MRRVDSTALLNTMRSFYDLMGVPPTGFDPEHRFVTSWLVSPLALASLRLLFSLYCFATTFTNWGWDGIHHDTQAIGREFSYFTDLTYWGLTFWFLVASVHGFVYTRHGQSWLDRWPRPLQMLHSFYYSTITTLPFLVTIVYWVVLFSGSWYTETFDAWTNISRHGLNSFFALTEIVLTTTKPLPLLHLPFLWVILALYLGLAYLTHAVQGWYPYSFLDPGVDGHHRGRVAAYSFGILAAITVIFGFVWALIWVRTRICRRAKRSQRDVRPGFDQSTFGNEYGHSGDVEMRYK